METSLPRVITLGNTVSIANLSNAETAGAIINQADLNSSLAELANISAKIAQREAEGRTGGGISGRRVGQTRTERHYYLKHPKAGIPSDLNTTADDSSPQVIPPKCMTPADAIVPFAATKQARQDVSDAASKDTIVRGGEPVDPDEKHIAVMDNSPLGCWKTWCSQCKTFCEWGPFDNFIFAVIIFNVLALCIALSLADTPKNDVINSVLENSQLVCLGIYTVELFLKLCGYSTAYFSDRWNWIDCSIVLIDWVGLIPGGGESGPDLSSLRVLRVLRTLRALTHFPQLKVLVGTMLMSIMALGEVMVVLMFLLLLFSIMGLQLFMGLFHNRCILKDNYTDFPQQATASEEEYRHYEQIMGDWDNTTAGGGIPFAMCSNFIFGGFQCPHYSTCVGFGEEGYGKNPYNGLVSFDNMFSAMLTVFVELTTSNWTHIMYMAMRTWNELACLYFVLIVTTIAYFAVNLVVAVIGDNLDTEETENVVDAEFIIQEEDIIQELLLQREIYALWDEQVPGPCADGNSTRASHRAPPKKLTDKKAVSILSLKKRVMTMMHHTQKLPPAPLWMVEPESHWVMDEDEDKWTQRARDMALIKRAVAKTRGMLAHRLDYLRGKPAIVWWINSFCESFVFKASMMLLIVVNTLALAIDNYDIEEHTKQAVVNTNLMCTVLFGFEMIVLIVAYGPRGYLEDPLNIFDGVLVIMSVSETIVAGGDSGGVASAFRAIRILRVLRVAKFIQSLRIILSTVNTALTKVVWMVFLLMFVIFVFALFGVQLFREPFQDARDEGIEVQTRHAWKNLYYASLNVFQIVTMDNWPGMMQDCSILTDDTSLAYFLIVIVIGNYLVFYMFVAIIIISFEGQIAQKFEFEDMIDRAAAMSTFNVQFEPSVCNTTRRVSCCRHFFRFMHCGYKCFRDRERMDQLSLSLDKMHEQLDPIEFALLRLPLAAQKKFRADLDSIEKAISVQGSQSADAVAVKSPVKIKALDSIKMAAGKSLEDEALRIDVADAAGFDDPTKNPTRTSPQMIEMTSPPMRDDTLATKEQQPEPEPRKLSEKEVSKADAATKKWHLQAESRTPDSLAALMKERRVASVKAAMVQRPFAVTPTEIKSEAMNNYRDCVEALGSFKNVQAQIDTLVCELIFMFLLRSRIWKYERRLELRASREVVEPALEGTSCGCLGADNAWRKRVYWLCSTDRFKDTIAITITFNCLFLAVEYPAMPSGGWLELTLFVSDILFCTIFTAEMTLKIIAWGFLYSGPSKSAYLQNGYNAIDFIVVCASVGSFVLMGFGEELPFLRAVRAFRPLRVIVRFDKIRVVVDSLLYTLPSIGHVALFCLLMWIMFAILGVTLFKGAYRKCLLNEDFDDSLTKDECSEAGGKWENPTTQNFDNVANAINLLFSVSTGDGWTNYMFDVRDSLDSDIVPVYFIGFLLVCTFFQLELFVGVVVDNFNNLKEIFNGSALMTKEQRDWQATMRLMTQVKLRKDLKCPEHKFRAVCWMTSHSKELDVFIMAAICLNTFTMMLPHNGMSTDFEEVLNVSNNIFVAVFTVEAAIKITGFGWTTYWADSWNKFDFVIVVLSFVGYPLAILKVNVDTNVIRMLRIGRLFRMVKAVPALQTLSNTLVLSLPSLWNVGAFIVVVFYIYAVIAVDFFGNVALTPSGLTKWANFRNFPVAMLTLFRLVSGDSWTQIATGCNLSVDLEQCEKSCADGDFCGCGATWAPWFFLSFSLVTSIVMVNLFVAVILENFGNSNDTLAKDLFFRTANIWSREWQVFDIDGNGMVTWQNFYQVLEKTPVPWGFGELNISELDRLRVAIKLDVPMWDRTRFEANATHVEMPETGHMLEFNTDAADEISSHETQPKGMKKTAFFMTFHPALLGMVKYVGFPDIELKSEKKEAEKFLGKMKDETLYCFHHAVAAMMIAQWWKGVKGGLRYGEITWANIAKNRDGIKKSKLQRRGSSFGDIIRQVQSASSETIMNN